MSQDTEGVGVLTAHPGSLHRGPSQRRNRAAGQAWPLPPPNPQDKPHRKSWTGQASSGGHLLLLSTQGPAWGILVGSGEFPRGLCRGRPVGWEPEEQEGNAQGTLHSQGVEEGPGCRQGPWAGE